MKKILLPIIACLLISIHTQAQIANYTFSTAVSTYTEITGGTILGSTSTDDRRFLDPAVPLGTTITTTGVGFPIGFTFVYNGVNYDRLAINANGWLSLGQSSQTPSVNIYSSDYYTAISATSTAPAALQDRIVAFGRDLQAQAGAELRIETIGTSPNQVLVVQWKGYKKYGSTGTGDSYNYQIRLNETTNIVELVYGTMTNNATAATPQVGLRGDANTDYNNRTTTTDWAASTAGAVNYATMTLSSSVFPVPGLVYRFTPPVVYSYDAAVSAINSPLSLVTLSNSNVDVTIKNYASLLLTDATIAWSVNGSLQTPYAYSGAGIAQNATAGPVNIGTYSFGSPGYYTIKAWTENPNGNPDQNTVNDTTTKIVYFQGYAPLPFIENFDATWINKFNTREVPGTFWNNTPLTGNNSWRRDDDGVAAGWSLSSGGGYTPSGSEGTAHSAKFHSYGASSGLIGYFDLYLDFTIPGTKILKFWYINTSGTDMLEVSVSTDGGTTFSLPQQFAVSIGWTLEQIALGSATDANTVIRFKATSDYGDDDIGIDKVEVSILQPDDAGINAINGPVSPVSAIAPVDVTIKNYGYMPLTSATIDWSVNGVLQTPFLYVNGGGLVTDATDGPITIGSYDFTAAGLYTIKTWTSIPNGNIDGNNNNDTTIAMVFTPGYATLPYSENFDGSWISKSSTNDVPSLYWNNTPATGNNSWRRDDEGATGGWTALTSGPYSPAGASSTAHSARFHSYDASIGSSGTFDLNLDFSTVGTKELQFWYINTSGSDSLDIYLSTDNGANFTFLQQFNQSPSWTLNSVPLGTSTGANTILRFKATSDWGVSDIGLDGVHVYLLAANDVGVSGIISPVSGICGNLNDSVTVIVHNFGTDVQTNVPVVATITTPGGPVNFADILAGPLNPGEADTIYLGSLNTLIPFSYSITANTDLATDTVFTNDTLNGIFTIIPVLTVPHLEDFEGGTLLANWNSTFIVGNGHGNTANVLYKNLYSSVPVATAIMTRKIGQVTGNSVLSFDYRITNYSDGSATTLGLDTIVFFLSTDCGTSYVPVYFIGASTHVPATSMKHVVIPIGALSGTEVIPAIYAQRGTVGDYYLDFDNIAISEPAVVNLGPNENICTGSSITLDAGNAPTGYTYTYEWSTLNHPVAFATTQAITTDTAATYVVAVNNGYGLITTDTIVISLLPLPIVNLGSDVSSCGSYTLDAGNSGSTYSWSDGGTTETITVTSTNTYTVTVTDGNGCSASDDIIVTILPLPIVNLGSDFSACVSFTIDAGAGASSYLWSTTETTQTITGTVSGTYFVTVTNSDGCTASDDIAVTLLPVPIVALGPDASACGSYSIDAGNSGSSYSWSTGGTTETITVTATDTYTVTVTNIDGCTASDDIQVSITPLPTADAGTNQSHCYLDTMHLMDATAANYDSLLWTSSGDGHFNDSTLLHPYYIAGANDVINGSVNLTLTAYAMCDTVSSVMTITISTTITAFAGNDVSICNGETVTLSASGGSTYQWNTGGLTSSINVSPSATTTYTVTAASGCGTAIDSVIVAVHHVTPVSLGPDTTLCSNSAMLDAGAGYDTYLWSTNDTTQIITLSATGDYSVTVTDSTGCAAIDTVHILYLLSPVAHVTGDTLICDGSLAYLSTDTGFVSYLWNGTHVGSELDTVATTGSYWVLVTAQNGCTAHSDTLHVDIFNLSDINLGPNVTIHLTEYVILDAGNGYNHYSWSIGANTQTVTVFANDLGLGSHIVWAEAWMDEGCFVSDSITITVINNNGIDELSDGSGFIVYPNPANNYTEVIVPASWSNTDLNVNLTDVAGRSIKKMNVSNTSSIKIDLEGIAPGMYQIIVSNGNEQSNIKLIVQ